MDCSACHFDDDANGWKTSAKDPAALRFLILGIIFKLVSVRSAGDNENDDDDDDDVDDDNDNDDDDDDDDDDDIGNKEFKLLLSLLGSLLEPAVEDEEDCNDKFDEGCIVIVGTSISSTKPIPTQLCLSR